MTTPVATQPVSWKYPYDPSNNPRQVALHACDAQEILFGGSAGPGKTDALLAAGVMFCLVVPNGRAFLFRRTYKQLEIEIIPRLLARIPSTIAKYNKSDHTFTFNNGAIFRLAYLQNRKDLENYQGAEIHLALWDELTQFDRYQYMYIRSRLRVTGIPAAAMAERGWIPRMISSSNPIGPGHGWVKRMFVDPSPGGDVVFEGGIEPDDPPEGKRSICYIPALARDNPFLDQVAYARELSGLDEELRRALMEGDWGVLQGVRFNQFRRSTHVIRPEQLPVPLVDYPRGVGVDYGMAAEFVALWGAVLPDNLVVIYRELSHKEWTADQQVSAILAAEDEGERIPGRPIPVALDPSTWERAANNVTRPLDPDEPAPGSIAWYYKRKLGGALVKAWNNRVGGAQLLDHHLLVRDDGLPRILIYSTCTDLIRTIPELQRSDVNPNDISQKPKQDDHWYDALRYLLGLLVRGGTQRVAEEAPTTRDLDDLVEGVIDERYDTLLSRHREAVPLVGVDSAGGWSS